MKATLIAFNNNIEELRQQIACLDLQWRIIKLNASASNGSAVENDVASLNEMIGSGVFRRQFEYNSIIVTLYGLFEQYVESMAVAFLCKLNDLVPLYSKLPQSVRCGNIELTTTLLSKPDLQKYRDSCKPVDLVSNLHLCLTDNLNYKINSEAFTYHTANFRSDVVDVTFARIGISNLSNLVKSTKSFSKFLEETYPERLSFSTVADVFIELNDLAERRNDVAHGSPSEIFSNSIALDYLAFVKEYASAVAQVSIAESLKYEAEYRGRCIGKPIAVYNNSIICLRLEHLAVAVGDRILAKTNGIGSAFVEGEILEIQLNKVAYQELICQAPVEVALRVEFKAKDTFMFYLLEPAVTPWSVDAVV